MTLAFVEKHDDRYTTGQPLTSGLVVIVLLNTYVGGGASPTDK